MIGQIQDGRLAKILPSNSLQNAKQRRAAKWKS